MTKKTPKKVTKKPRTPTIKDMIIVSNNPDETIRMFENRYYYLAYTLRNTKNITSNNCFRRIRDSLNGLIKLIVEDKTQHVDKTMIYNILLFAKLYLKANNSYTPIHKLSRDEINNLLINIKEKSLNNKDIPLKTLKLM